MSLLKSLPLLSEGLNHLINNILSNPLLQINGYNLDIVFKLWNFQQ